MSKKTVPARATSKTTTKPTAKTTAKATAKGSGTKPSKTSTTNTKTPASNGAAMAARLKSLENQIRSLESAQAVIEFTPTGTILSANENFLDAMGYRLEEIVGKHHSMFVADAERRKPEYREFWDRLAAGNTETGQCRRMTKSGQEIWLQASYNPVIAVDGRVEKVIKYAVDITPERQRMADFESQLKSINSYQAVIEFKLDGTIVNANQNFLDCVGYSLSEITGRHHRLFVDPAQHQSPEYQSFWEKLARGSADSGQYRRVAKGEREVWLQASYCPIFDAEGRPFKVVKYATEITAAKRMEQEMSRVVSEAGRVFQMVAEGNLQNEMQGEYTGEFGNLKEAVNRCVRDLNAMVGQIRASSMTITGSSKEISSGNQDLSERTEQQAASIEETASSMEELTGTVRQNADNARQANQLASNAREQAERGGSVVSSAISAMRSINEASNKIADIIGVIDEIAFQTNLLALNAAVEAARAGEQGRGFAVVASEVRNLAQRSAGAAKEIKALIKDSVSRVEEGSRLVNDSGETLSTIVNAVKKVSDIIAEIAEASMEQSVGIDKVNQAITEMDQAVQQNAALVEEVAAASGAMDQQSQALSLLMDRFQITAEAERNAMQMVQGGFESAPRFASPAPGQQMRPVRAPQASSYSRGVQRPAVASTVRRPGASQEGTRGVARLAERVEEKSSSPVAAGQGRWEEF
jgi:methyl-accepting chemotaxis protein